MLKKRSIFTGRKKIVKIKLLIIILFPLLLVLAGLGCDRQVIIHGKIYEWIDPPDGAQSQIYHKVYTSHGLLNEELPADADLQPLKDAQVQCFGTVKTNTFYSNEISDEKGEFKLVITLGQMTEDYPATIEVTKTGYQSIEREIVDTGADHTINVILVKE